MTRTILTDLGRVVVGFNTQRVAQNFHRQIPHRRLDEIEYLLFEDERGIDLFERFETGRIPSDRYQQEISHLLDLPKGIEPTMFWNCHCDMFTNNVPVIELWKRTCVPNADVRLIAFSDCDPIRLNYVLRQTGVAFSRVVASFTVGVWKPHDDMFKTALKVSECPPASIFYVDDKPGNVQAGSEYGFVSHRYDPDDPERDTFLERSLNDFLASP